MLRKRCRARAPHQCTQPSAPYPRPLADGATPPVCCCSWPTSTCMGFTPAPPSSGQTSRPLVMLGAWIALAGSPGDARPPLTPHQPGRHCTAAERGGCGREGANWGAPSHVVLLRPPPPTSGAMGTWVVRRWLRDHFSQPPAAPRRPTKRPGGAARACRKGPKGLCFPCLKGPAAMSLTYESEGMASARGTTLLVPAAGNQIATCLPVDSWSLLAPIATLEHGSGGDGRKQWAKEMHGLLRLASMPGWPLQRAIRTLDDAPSSPLSWNRRQGA